MRLALVAQQQQLINLVAAQSEFCDPRPHRVHKLGVGAHNRQLPIGHARASCSLARPGTSAEIVSIGMIASCNTITAGRGSTPMASRRLSGGRARLSFGPLLGALGLVLIVCEDGAARPRHSPKRHNRRQETPCVGGIAGTGY